MLRRAHRHFILEAVNEKLLLDLVLKRNCAS